jgi:acyl-CoA-binding protein
MEIKAQFEEAVKRVEALTQRPQNDELLKLYGLYKQATEGDIHGDPPGGFDFKGLAKYNAWKEQTGKTPEESMTRYVAFAEELIRKYT